MMLRILLVVALIMFVSGCGLFSSNPTYIRKVPAVPLVSMPIEPAYQVDTLVEASKQDPGQVAIAYASTVEQMRSHIQSLTFVLQQYIDLANKVKQLQELEESINE